MSHLMENQLVAAKIETKGAELVSFVLKADGCEYIWQANPKFWGRHAPILFPIVGKLRDNTYRFQEQTYNLPQHGFARDLPFKLIKSEPTSCIYKLEANRDTVPVYPFKFQLEVGYFLQQQTLTVEYTVINREQETMYFSIGGHPGFNCPILESEVMEDYYLEFDKKEDTLQYAVADGLISDKTTPFSLEDKKLPLSHQLFVNDAIVLKDLNSSQIQLKSSKSAKKVTVDFPDFPYLGIWSKPDPCGFICIEPWYGIADPIDSEQELTKKPGVISLQAQQKFSCAYRITIE